MGLLKQLRKAEAVERLTAQANEARLAASNKNLLVEVSSLTKVAIDIELFCGNQEHVLLSQMWRSWNNCTRCDSNS
ncbi:MAG: hypothetical protein OXI96_09180 [Acidimicrobiaceae bacterium]|nr:hypothetical protein [Acidimicrobiaceae bacterium]